MRGQCLVISRIYPERLRFCSFVLHHSDSKRAFSIVSCHLSGVKKMEWRLHRPLCILTGESHVFPILNTLKASWVIWEACRYSLTSPCDQCGECNFRLRSSTFRGHLMVTMLESRGVYQHVSKWSCGNSFAFWEWLWPKAAVPLVETWGGRVRNPVAALCPAPKPLNQHIADGTALGFHPFCCAGTAWFWSCSNTNNPECVLGCLKSQICSWIACCFVLCCWQALAGAWSSWVFLCSSFWKQAFCELMK
jgi:hypothetical protein